MNGIHWLYIIVSILAFTFAFTKNTVVGIVFVSMATVLINSY